VIIPQSRPTVLADDIKAVDTVLRNGQLSMGSLVSSFEDKFKEFIGTAHATAVNSGTSALHLSLLALGVKPDTEVILPSYACTALLNAVRYTGANPIIADISPDSFCLSVDDVKRKTTSRTAAIITVHTFGMPADVQALSSIGIPVVEDCAHSIGGHIDGKRMGTFGNASIYSFYPTKMITSGEGGMIATSSSKVAGIVRDLRAYDGVPEYTVRYNYKMTDISAALGLTQLSKLKTFIDKRRGLAKQYDKFFKGFDTLSIIGRAYDSDVCYRYVALMGNESLAKKFIKDMRSLDIYCDSPVSKPLHQYLNLKNSDFPVTQMFFERTVSIPIYPSLTDTEVERVLSSCRSVLERVKSLCESF